MWAAGKPAIVRLLLDKRADVRVAAKSWRVSSVNYTPVIGTLGSTGIPWVNAGEFVTTAGGETALIAAARAGDLESAKMLVAAGADVNQAAADGATPLLAALYNWNLVAPRVRMPVVPAAAAVGLDPNIPRPQFQPSVELARFLLEHGAKADVADGSGFTPLHAAVLMVHPPAGGLTGDRNRGAAQPPSAPKGESAALPLVRRLLEAGADPNRGTLWPTPGPVGEVRISPAPPGSTPMHIAAQVDSPALAELLAQFKGDPNRTRKDGHSPLSLAAKKNDVAVMEVLAKYGADFRKTYDPTDEIPDAVESKTLQRRKQTLLHIAGAAGAVEAIRYLASVGVPLEARNVQGETALDLADQQEVYRYKAKIEGAVGVGDKNAVRDTRATDALKALGVRSAIASGVGPKTQS
jgi:ankyrin repeat protein